MGKSSLAKMYPNGISKMMTAELRQENDDSAGELHDSFEPMPPVGDPGRLTMHLRKKRQSALMKQMLKQGGYGDLARMVSLRSGGG